MGENEAWRHAPSDLDLPEKAKTDQTSGLENFVHDTYGHQEKSAHTHTDAPGPQAPQPSLSDREAAFDQKVRDLVVSGQIDQGAYKLDFSDWVNPKNLHSLGHAIMEGDQAQIKQIEDSIKDPKELQRTLDTLKKLGLDPQSSTNFPIDSTPTVIQMPTLPHDATFQPLPPFTSPHDTTAGQPPTNPAVPHDTTAGQPPVSLPHDATFQPLPPFTSPHDTTAGQPPTNPAVPHDTTAGQPPRDVQNNPPQPDAAEHQRQLQEARLHQMEHAGSTNPEGQQFSVHRNPDGSFVTEDRLGRVQGIYYPDGVSSREFFYSTMDTGKNICRYSETGPDGRTVEHRSTNDLGYDWNGKKQVIRPQPDGSLALIDCDKGHPQITVYDSSGKQLSPQAVANDQKKRILEPIVNEYVDDLKHRSQPFNPLTIVWGRQEDQFIHKGGLDGIAKDRTSTGGLRLAAALTLAYMSDPNHNLDTVNPQYLGNVAGYGATSFDKAVSRL